MEEKIILYCQLWGGCLVLKTNGNESHIIDQFANLKAAQKYVTEYNKKFPEPFPVEIIEHEVYQYGEKPRPEKIKKNVTTEELADNTLIIAIDGTPYHRDNYTKESWLNFFKLPDTKKLIPIKQ